MLKRDNTRHYTQPVLQTEDVNPCVSGCCLTAIGLPASLIDRLRIIPDVIPPGRNLNYNYVITPYREL